MSSFLRSVKTGGSSTFSVCLARVPGPSLGSHEPSSGAGAPMSSTTSARFCGGRRAGGGARRLRSQIVGAANLLERICEFVVMQHVEEKVLDAVLSNAVLRPWKARRRPSRVAAALERGDQARRAVRGRAARVPAAHARARADRTDCGRHANFSLNTLRPRNLTSALEGFTLTGVTLAVLPAAREAGGGRAAVGHANGPRCAPRNAGELVDRRRRRASPTPGRVGTGDGLW